MMTNWNTKIAPTTFDILQCADDDSQMLYTEPLTVLAMAFPDHKFSVCGDTMCLCAPAAGIETTIEVNFVDVERCKTRLASLFLQKFTLNYIGRCLIANAVRNGVVDRMAFSVRERGMRTPFSVHTEPYEVSLERLMQLVMLHLKLTNTDTAPKLEIEPMAPRKTRDGYNHQLFRCFFVHKKKRAAPAVFCTSIEQAQKHALIHLLVGLTKLS